MRPLSKELKEQIEMIIPTEGMVEYDCLSCGEPFGTQPELTDPNTPLCGICQHEADMNNYDYNEHQ